MYLYNKIWDFLSEEFSRLIYNTYIRLGKIYPQNESLPRLASNDICATVSPCQIPRVFEKTH